LKATGADVAQPIPMPSGGEALPHGFALSDDFSTNRIGTQWAFFHPRGPIADRYRYEDGALVIAADGTSPRDSSPLQLVAGDLSCEMEVEIEIGEGTTAALILFYNEKLFTGLGFSDKHMIEYRRGDITLVEKPAAIGNHFFIRLRNNRNVVTLWYSPDGVNWTKYRLLFEVSGFHHNVAGGFLSLRPALLVAGKGEAKFRHFKYKADSNRRL
ncbi:MAG TPA: hypothetical protein PKI32_05355, partial [Opitutales bacterium]|nr:hypothetical protein [Opitutales bacterium]